MRFSNPRLVAFLTAPLFLIFLSFSIKASEGGLSLSETKPIRISLSSFYKNKSVFRGAETWPEPSYFAGPGFIFFDKWLVRGPGLFYSHFPRTSPFVFTAGISYFDDGEPWPDTSDHNPIIEISGKLPSKYPQISATNLDIEIPFTLDFLFIKKLKPTTVTSLNLKLVSLSSLYRSSLKSWAWRPRSQSLYLWPFRSFRRSLSKRFHFNGHSPRTLGGDH